MFVSLALTVCLYYSVLMAKNKKRPQTPKPRNEDWMRARLRHSNQNLSVPAKTGYNRKPKYRSQMFQEV